MSSRPAQKAAKRHEQVSCNVARLFGADETTLHELVVRVAETAAYAYWESVDRAIQEVLKHHRIWDGSDDGLVEAQRFVAGQMGLEALGDGTLRIMMFGELAAVVEAPSFELPEPPPEESRIIQ